MIVWLTWGRLIQVILSVLTLTTLTSFLGGWIWWLDIVADLRLQYAIGAGVMFLAAVVARRMKASALAVVLIGLNGFMVAPHITTAPQAPAKIKIVGFNLSDQNTDTAPILDFLRKEDADVLVLTEVTATWRKALEQLSDMYPHRFFGPPTKFPWEPPVSIGLFSKRAWKETGVERDEKSSWILAVWARFPDTSPGLTVTGVHLTNPVNPKGGNQVRDLETLVSTLKRFDGSVVVMGDFNMTPFSTRYRQLLRSTGLRRADGGLNSSWPALLGRWGLPIDHMLVGSGIRHAVMQVGPRLSSDHLPIIGKFDL